MFSIVTSQAIEDCEQLERCVLQFAAQNLETEAIIRELGSLSGMGEVLTRLKAQHGTMQEENRALRQMMQALDKTVLYYRNCENRICENGEQSMIRYARREIGMNDFSRISNLLGEVLWE